MYNILPSLQMEIALLCEALDDNSQIEWQSPIAHMIHHEPKGTAYSDSCLHSGGGFSIDIGFWGHMEWPSWVYHHMKKFFASDMNGHFITINVLEFISVIINYSMAYTAGTEMSLREDPWPVMLTWCDNISMVDWMNHM